MSTTLEQAQTALNEQIAGFKRTIADGTERLNKNDEAIAALQKGVQAVQAAQESLNRSAFERNLSTDEDRMLRRYFPEDDALTKAAMRATPKAFVKNEMGCVALYGHTTHEGRAWRWGLLDDPATKTEWQRELQAEVTLRNVVRASMQPDESGARHTPIADDRINRLLLEAPDSVGRVLSKGVTAQGAELVPNNLFPELERATQHAAGFATIFDERPLPPSGQMILPYIEGNFRPTKGAAATINDPANYDLSDIGTRQNSIAAVRNVIATQIDILLPEESLIALAPEIMESMSRAFALGDDDIAINGDTAGTHQDAIASWNTRGLWGSTGLGASNDHRRSALGLRARGKDLTGTATDLTAAQDYAGVLAGLKKMGPEYYARMHQGRLKLATSPEWFLGYLTQFSQFLTWDKVGAAATVLTGFLGGRKGPSPGSVGMLNGFLECVITPLVTADLASTGLYTGSGSTTSHLIFEAGDFEWRSVPGILLEQERSVRNGVITFVAVRRRVFRTKANDTTSEKKNVHYGYNLTA